MPPRSLLALVFNFFSEIFLICMDFSYFTIAKPCTLKIFLKFYPAFLGILFGIFCGGTEGHLICRVAQNVNPMDNI